MFEVEAPPTISTFTRSDGKEIPLLPQPACELCSKPLRQNSWSNCYACNNDDTRVDGSRLERVYAAALYQRGTGMQPTGSLSKEIWTLKERSAALAPLLAEVMVEAERRLYPGVFADVDVVTSAPRGSSGKSWDQAALLAQPVAAAVDVEYRPLIVKAAPYAARHETDHQTKLAGQDVAMNCTENVSGLDVLVIDDVYNTGSTMAKCAAALKNHGAARVRGFVLGRAVDKPHLRYVGLLPAEDENDT